MASGRSTLPAVTGPILWRVLAVVWRSGRLRAAQNLDHRLVQAEVAGEHRGPAKLVRLARGVAHDAARLAQQQQAGRDVPRGETVFEERIVAAGGEEGEIERSGTPAAHARGAARHRLELAMVVGVVILADIGDAGGDQ